MGKRAIERWPFSFVPTINSDMFKRKEKDPEITTSSITISVTTLTLIIIGMIVKVIVGFFCMKWGKWIWVQLFGVKIKEPKVEGSESVQIHERADQ